MMIKLFNFLRYNIHQMKISAYKTPIIQPGDDLFQHLSQAIPSFPEKSVVVIASKMVSTCENRFVSKKTGTAEEKHELVRQEADFFIDPHASKYDIMLTVKQNWMFVNAGIDESNANGQYILWPQNPQQSAVKIWQFLREHFGVTEVGVTLSDSSSFPFNWGVIGRAIAYCGFNPLRSYIGQPDLFGRELKMEQANVMQSVTAAATLEMGEGNESTPLAVVTQIKDIQFQDQPPSPEELVGLKIEIENDIYAPILTTAPWQKGGSGSSK